MIRNLGLGSGAPNFCCQRKRSRTACKECNEAYNRGCLQFRGAAVGHWAMGCKLRAYTVGTAALIGTGRREPYTVEVWWVQSRRGDSNSASSMAAAQFVQVSDSMRGKISSPPIW